MAMGMTVMCGLPLAFASQPKRWQWPQYWQPPKREPSRLVPRLARNRRRVFELVVIRLELVVGDAPVLDGHILGDVLLAVAFLVEAAHLELHVGPAPGVAAPVHARAADDVPGQERPEPAHRQRFLRHVVAPRDSFLLRVTH